MVLPAQVGGRVGRCREVFLRAHESNDSWAFVFFAESSAPPLLVHRKAPRLDSTTVDRFAGYRGRPWETRPGEIDLQIPKLRKGSYFPEWLLEPRRRSEKALMAAIAEAYVLGVST